MHQLQINPDGSERIAYTWEGMPVRMSEDHLQIFQDYAAACHWHEEFEILEAAEGEMDYFVSGQRVHLKRGDGVFVNARRLHYGYSEERKDCLYRFVVFHPDLVGELKAVREAIIAFSADDRPDYWHLDASSEGMMQFRALYEASCQGDVLGAVSSLTSLISILSHMDTVSSGEYASDWVTLRKMTGFIQAHFEESLKLEEIAAAGSVCRSSCCNLFRERLGVSPMEYVTRYRLWKACVMLREGFNVTEAALACGFHGGSYFAEVFKKTYHMTPKKYQSSFRE